MAMKIFFCYAREDEDLLNKLKRQLWPLQRQGLIAVWHDRDINAGTEWEREINQHLNEAQIILLLVSPDFMYSEYCYSVEMKRALERHQRGEARVIPVILRPVYWQGILGHLQALPRDALPVTDPDWQGIDRALYNVTEGIRRLVEQKSARPAQQAGEERQVFFSPTSEETSAHAAKAEERAQAADKPTAVSSPPAKIPEVASTPTTTAVPKQLPAQPLPSVKPEAISLLRTLSGHKSWVLSVSISPDGLILASGSDDKTIKLWDVATGQEVKILTGHKGPVNTVAFSPNGQTLASGSDDNTIKLWDVATGQEVRSLPGHISYVDHVAFSPDGQTLASCDHVEQIKLWNVATGREVRNLSGHLNNVLSVAFSPDGRTLASGGRDMKIRLWNVATGQELRTFTWDTSGAVYYQPGKSTVLSVAFSPDGLVLASGSDDKTIKLWNVSTGRYVRNLTGHKGYVTSVVFSPDGETLASGSHDGTIKLWNLASEQALRTLTEHKGSVSSVVFSPDGQILASGSHDGTIKIWGEE